MLDEIINAMLVMRDTETIELENNLWIFDEILIQLINKQKNIRWCNNKRCKCHPETKLLALIEKNEIKNFLIENNLYNEIKEIANEDYKPITVFNTKLVNKYI